MQNAKCKRKLQMQNANLKFWSKPKILPKPKIFAKQEFYSPLACKHLCWPLLRRMCIMIVIVDFYLHLNLVQTNKNITTN